MTPEDREKELLERRIEEGEKEIDDAIRKIYRKPIPNLSLDDKRFLQARRSYLNKEMTEKYEDVLKEKLPRPDGQDVEEEKQIEELTHKELEKMAKEIGIEESEIKKATSNPKLQELIKQKQEELEKGE